MHSRRQLGLPFPDLPATTQSVFLPGDCNAAARAWCDALGVSSVGLSDNFFDLGAHSLTVAEVQARLQQDLGRDIALVDLFEFSSVASLAAHLAGDQIVAAVSQASARAQRRRLARNT